MHRRSYAVIAALSLVAGLVPAFAAAPATARPTRAAVAARPRATVRRSPTGSYVVVMRTDPLLSLVSPDRLDTPSAVRRGKAMERSHDSVLTDAGIDADAKVHDYTNTLNGFSAVLDHDDAQAIAADPDVALVVPDELHQLQRASTGGSSAGGTGGVDHLANFVGLTEKGEAWRSGLTGQGVVVGVIDSGIWPEHPSFKDDGTLAPAEPLSDERPACEFGNTEANPDDAPFTCNNKLIGARQMLDTYRELIGAEPDEFDSARDDDGHGTHTASTAAGNKNVRARILGRDYGHVSGIAPRAQIIAYKALGNDGGFSSDLAAAIDQAVADGVDVINYSVGGGPDLTGPDAISFLFAADAGVAVSVSAGNDGPDDETIGGPADVPWVTSVGANTQPQFLAGTIVLGNGTRFQGASVSPDLAKRRLVDAEAAGTSDQCLEGSLDPALVAGAIVLCKRGGNGRIAKSYEVFNAGGAGMILYNEVDVDTLFSDTMFVPTVHIDLTPGLAIKDYIATSASPKAAIDAGYKTVWPTAPNMAYFSSRGPNPTAADIIKPDITAPGVQILAGNTPFPTPGESPSGELFQAIAGTSMSAPVVAGSFALLKQAHPTWSAAAIKSAIMTTARTDVRDYDRVHRATPFAMGAGMVRPGVVQEPGSAFRPGLVYDAGFDEYLGFLCDTAPDVFGPDAEATCTTLDEIGVPTDASDLNLPSIAVQDLAGSRTVTRTVTNVERRTLHFDAKVRAPKGFTVQVTPAHLRIKAGQSKTFTVTITNDGTAALDEWAFGSMVWVGNGFRVRSPLAVKATALSAPEIVSGTGTDGSVSVDVQFGYEGVYAPTAHGLVAPVPLEGTIDQDPDQTWPSDDDAAGVDEITIDVQDVAFARWQLVIPGDDDIDLFLLDPNGDLVALSATGGTNETIDLVAPENGTYTLIVHGWEVPSAPLAYSVSSWLVPATPGGSLAISAAPAGATIGATGTVELEWTGLTAGTQYLGALAHRDESDVVGLTLVAVDA